MAKLSWAKLTSKNAVLRFLAAMVLLVWIGNTLPPLAVLAADNSCQLNCCHDLARHPAGSCADGVCHLKPQKKLQSPEIICGAKELAEKRIAAHKKRKNSFATKHSPNVPIFDETPSRDSRDADGFPLLYTRFLEQSCQTV